MNPQFKQPTKKQRVKGPTTEHDISCSLENLYNGLDKKVKIIRNVCGKKETRILTITIHPGWKEDTKKVDFKKNRSTPIKL